MHARARVKHGEAEKSPFRDGFSCRFTLKWRPSSSLKALVKKAPSMESVVSANSAGSASAPPRRAPGITSGELFCETDRHHPAPCCNQEAFRGAAATGAAVPFASCLSAQPSVVRPGLLITSVSLPLHRLIRHLSSLGKSESRWLEMSGSSPRVVLFITGLWAPGTQRHSSQRWPKVGLGKGTTMENLLTAALLVVIISRHVGLITKASSTQ